MSAVSKISWTNATWNPLVGCSKVNEGCTFCYAMREVHRMAGNPNPNIATANAGLTKIVNGRPAWTGKVNLVESRLEQPLHWREPRRVFVNSLSDLFHEAVPRSFIVKVFAVMLQSQRHQYTILTKRGQRMCEILSDPGMLSRVAQEVALINGEASMEMVWPLPNVVLGVSVSDQPTADELIPWALRTPAAFYMLSIEPMLGPVILPPELLALGSRLVVVVGGESGPGARPMHPQWVRAIRDQCQAAGVAFHFKQWGEWAPGGMLVDRSWIMGSKKTVVEHHGHSFEVHRVGKKRAGRLLDGRTWDGWVG